MSLFNVFCIKPPAAIESKKCKTNSERAIACSFLFFGSQHHAEVVSKKTCSVLQRLRKILIAAY